MTTNISTTACSIEFNAKLGGQYALPQTHELNRLRAQPFMIMGADVSHPGPGSGENRPSFASVVWSWNKDATEYVTDTTVQPPRTEIIKKLQTMVEKAIEGFMIQSPAPSLMIMYRDGVSEGQLDAVKTFEVKAIRAACKAVWARKGWTETKPLPALTFIVVVKRAADLKGNCRPGLAVEGLHSPWTRGFHLQSHAPIQGTARSGQYTILVDENYDMNSARIQQLSFELCHIYAKATRSISIPAPVYYADLVCSRAKFHLDPDEYIDLDGASNSDTFDHVFWTKQFKPVSRQNHYDKSMYFL
ncbi:Piwi domain-containing protein [Roridomyces roridus]|uniref:Piwi domain-containing protein n=1 Tax=Roridomyces roridus TaxID=1738132 RepID=A0AAD7BY85_9AGAR|nr:Piwi domain-containing protein [Roridomyces roridus]